MDFLEKIEEKKWVVLSIALSIVIMFLIFMTVFSKKEVVIEEATQTSSVIERQTEEASNQETQTDMYVDIKGAVVKPGIYQVNGNMRVLNVVELAGGFLKEADDKQINLSERVSDQMVIYIPKEGEHLEEIAINQQGSKADTDKSETLINLNTATIEELKQLNGVGDKKAENIIRHREEKGSFKVIDELKEVDGIGEKTFENLKSFITV